MLKSIASNKLLNLLKISMLLKKVYLSHKYNVKMMYFFGINILQEFRLYKTVVSAF